MIEMPIAFQELGHNIGLAHSARMACTGASCFKDEYGDFTDPMGSANPLDVEKTLICINAPQSYKAGWSKPIAGGHLNAFADLRPGIPQEFSLPAMALTKNNMLRIVTDTTNSIVNDAPTSAAFQRALFVSYRVHEFIQTANAMSADPNHPSTLHMAGLIEGPGNATTYTQMITGSGGIRIALKSRTALAATVTVCRFLNQTEAVGSRSCSDGADNDCDGLVDLDDPDCKPLSPPPQRSPPSSPPASSSRRSPPPLQRRKDNPPRPPPRIRATRG
ncbi:hypothetical protein PLESTF_000369900 [Pleodorina starrii]|nr:hypothetical protein PLESTF_000369900 [Pleodorina starrii]